jgi:uncharacterized membrane protein
MNERAIKRQGYGCTDPDYMEYDPDAVIDDGTCATTGKRGCTDTSYLDYDPEAIIDDGSCDTLKVYGCMDPSYAEYNPNANVHVPEMCMAVVTALPRSEESKRSGYLVITGNSLEFFNPGRKSMNFAIFDINGIKHIEKLIFPFGIFNFPLSKLHSGRYVVRLDTGEMIISRPFTVGR